MHSDLYKMEVGKLYKVDGVLYKLDQIMKFTDCSCLYIFSNEEDEEFMVTSSTKILPHYYNSTPIVSTTWSNEVIPV